MKKQSEFYSELSNKQTQELWQKCIFVLDTNVLLDIFRYTPESSSDLLDVLTQLRKRLWIPHQVMHEFMRNKNSAINDISSRYDHQIKSLNDAKSTAIGTISKILGRPTEKKLKEKLKSQTKESFEELSKHVHLEKERHCKKEHFEECFNKIISIFENQVGEPYTPEQLKDILDECSVRMKTKTPPGYEDYKPKEKNCPGDFILWKQIIAHAQKRYTSIIFITNDSKGDWWINENNSDKIPHPQLRIEFQKETDSNFYMYETERFLKEAKKYLNINIHLNTIKEVSLTGKRLADAYTKAINPMTEAYYEFGKKLTEVTSLRKWAANNLATEKDLKLLGSLNDSSTLVSKVAEQIRFQQNKLSDLTSQFAVTYEDLDKAAKAAGFDTHSEMINEQINILKNNTS